MKKGMKKILSVFFGIIFLIGLVSAWDIDITDICDSAYGCVDVSGSNIQNISFKTDEFKLSYSSDINNSNWDSCWYALNGVEASPFTCGVTWITGNMQPANEGANNWTLYVNDTNGTLQSDAIIFWVDSITPDLNYVTPSSNLGYTNTNTLTFQFWLNETNKKSYHPVNFAPFYLNIYDPWDALFDIPTLSNLSLTEDTLSEQYNKTLAFPNIGEGNYTFVIYAKDKYPNSTTIREVNLTGTIIRDITAPNISINSPANNSNLTGIVSIIVSAEDVYPTGVADISGFNRIAINITNSTGEINTTTLYSTPSIYNWDSLQVADGYYSINATSYDNAGNSNSSTINISVDNTAPQIFFNSPAAGIYNTTQLINITATDINLNQIILYVDGDMVNLTNTPELLYNLTEGNYSVYATADDIFGNTNTTETRNIEIDLTPPNLNWATLSPSIFSPNGYGINGLEIAMHASELIYEWGTTRVYNSIENQIKYFNSPSGSPDNTFNNTEIWNGTMSNGSFAPDGVYTINTTITDRANNTATIFVGIVEIDTTYPLIQFIDSTTASGNYSQNYIEANIFFSDTNLDRAVIYLYNESEIQYILSSSSPLNVNFTELADGTYYLGASANDYAGNENLTETRTIILDATPPKIWLAEEINESLSQTWIFLNVSVIEANEDTIIFTLYNFTGIINSTSFIDGTRTINWTGLAEGDYEYNVTINDTFGNSNYTRGSTEIDITKPVIENVSSSDITTSSATINWNINEMPFVIKVYYGTDQSTTNLIESSDWGTWVLTWTTGLSLSLTGLTSSTTYYYNVSSCDLAGNCNVSSQYSFTTSTPPTETPGGGGGGATTYSRCSEWNEWTECSGGTQTRTCKIKESVSSANKGPLSESRSCSIPSSSETETEEIIEDNTGENISEEPTEETPAGFGAGITGAVVGFTKSRGGKIILITLLVLGLAFAGLEIYRRRDLKKWGVR